jgi:hypothetical protein
MGNLGTVGIDSLHLRWWLARSLAICTTVVFAYACGGGGSDGGGDSCPNGCGTSQTCVNNIGCADLCSSSSQCATTCCSPLDNGQKACLPSSHCGGGSCPNGCGSSQICVNNIGCADLCSSSSQCSSNCCVPLTGGQHACLPSSSCSNPTPVPRQCVYHNECVGQLTFHQSNQCGDPNGATYSAVNVCDQALDFQICIQRCDGTWDCGIKTVQPGGKYSSYGCCSRNNFQVLAGPPSQFGLGCYPTP